MVALVACSGKASEQATVDNANIDTSLKTVDEEKESSTENATQSVSEDQGLLYESFLRNDAKVHVNSEYDFGDYSFEEVNDQDLTIGEIVNFLMGDATEDDTAWLTYTNYSYIDCGNDGVPELAIVVNPPSDLGGWSKYIIIKDIDGKLQTVYSELAWERGTVNINEYGYISENSTSGAAYHGFKKSFVGSVGKWHYIFSDETTDCIVPGGDLWFKGDSHICPNDIVGEYAFLEFDFNNSIEDFADNVYTYAKWDGDASESWIEGEQIYFYRKLIKDSTQYDDSHPLKTFFDENALHIYTLDEIEQMIVEKEKEEGLTDFIKQGKNVEWLELK